MVAKREYFEVKPIDIGKIGHTYYYSTVTSKVTEISLFGIIIYKKKEFVRANNGCSSWSKPKVEKYK